MGPGYQEWTRLPEVDHKWDQINEEWIRKGYRLSEMGQEWIRNGSMLLEVGRNYQK